MAANCERTFIAIKPDGVQRGLVGEIIKRFEQKGFRLVGMKFVHVSPCARESLRPSAGPSPATAGTSVYTCTSSYAALPASERDSDAVFAKSWTYRVTRQATFSISAIS